MKRAMLIVQSVACLWMRSVETGSAFIVTRSDVLHARLDLKSRVCEYGCTL